MKLKIIISTFALFTLCAVANAQFWPLPSYTTPNTPVQCKGCPGGSAGPVTPGWSDPIVKFTGRWMSSEYVGNWQQPFRTARAGGMRMNPAGTRYYVQFGNAVAAFDAARFISRLEAHETLVSSATVPVSPSVYRPDYYERFLAWDSFFYAENTDSGWLTPTADGQDRLFDFDIDERGYVYIAYSQFGWGVVIDTGTGAMMRPFYQDQTSLGWPQRIFWVKDGSTYYALVGGNSSPATHVYTVPDAPATPSEQAQLTMSVSRPARAGARTAVIDQAPNGKLYIYDNHALVTSGPPVQAYPPPQYGFWADVVWDGKSFWAASAGATGTLSVFTPDPADPSGKAYTRADYTLAPPGVTFQPYNMHWISDGSVSGSGYLSMVAGDAKAVHVYKTSGGKPTEITPNDYFVRYYPLAPHTAIVSAYPRLQNGNLYLVIAAMGLGDVYQIKTGDALTVNVSGTKQRPNATADNLYYGDQVGFIALPTAAGSQRPITWNYGSPKPLNDPTNQEAGLTNTVTYHPYKGLLPQDLASPFAVTATDEAGVVGQTSVSLKIPPVAFGVRNSVSQIKYLFAQPNASSPAPIVSDDVFFDASAGDPAGHYDEWRIGANAAAVTASGFGPDYHASGYQPAVGTPGGHTLQYIAHYGPYTTMTPPSPDPWAVTLPAVNGISTFSYTVKDLAAAIDVQGDDVHDQVVFSSSSRATVAISGQPVDYQWDIIDSTGSVYVPGGGRKTASSIAIPSWPVDRNKINKSGLKAQLQLWSPAGGSTSTDLAQSAFLNPPDAVSVLGQCSSAGDCHFSVKSTSGVTDGWTYAWSASGGPTTPASTNASFDFAVTQPGQYNISAAVVVKNTVGQAGPLTSGPWPVKIDASQCDLLVENTNVFVDYHGSPSGCNTGSPCKPSDSVTFNVTFWNYNTKCGTQSASWQFDDGTTATGLTSPARTFSAGNHDVTCTITSGTRQIVAKRTLSVSQVVQPPPDPGPNCAIVANTNFFVSYGGCKNGTNCTAGELISMSGSLWNYSSSCGTPQYSWTFDDGSTASGTTVTKSFLQPGSHTATCKVTAGSANSAQLTMTIPVGSGTTDPPPSCAPLVSGGNVFLDYLGSKSGCKATGANCGLNEPVKLTVSFWGYATACATPTYKWTFDDGTTDTTSGQTVTRAFSQGDHVVTCLVGFGTSTVTLSTTVHVSGSGVTPGIEASFDLQRPGAWNVIQVTPKTIKDGTYSWNFGAPGTICMTQSCLPSETLIGPTLPPLNGPTTLTYTYTAPGTYFVTLLVHTPNGDSPQLLQVTISPPSRGRPNRH